MFTANRRIQLGLLAVSLLYHVFLITALYSTNRPGDTLQVLSRYT